MLSKQNTPGQLKLDFFFSGKPKEGMYNFEDQKKDSNQFLNENFDNNSINHEIVNSSPVITSDDYAAFDYDSTDEQTDSSSEFFEPSTNKEEPKSEIKPRSNYDSSRQYEPKPVLTPNWDKPETNEEETHNPTISECIYDHITDIHYQLEIIEHRIQMGKDEKHDHPAMSLQVLETEGLPNVTKKEKERKSRYMLIEEEHYLPRFWEPRSYDSQYKPLSKEDNESLEEMIRLSLVDDGKTSTIKTRQRTWNPHEVKAPYESAQYSMPTVKDTFVQKKKHQNENSEKLKVKEKKIRKKKSKVLVGSHAMICVPSMLFDTDLSDDTDFSDF
ncbi:hypothetical protein GPJ56_009857 [Histomonas meleagridis]|uniref:uncharacterized protein n=1 Tax=Histomonas meleagridis TaxID=135588 RepID=UPI00355A9CFB|nr:hypothetical protein GPJ56_009857 [Histomonas meleagridis]KAH0802836.1 hypothetical protein GO595_004343 [Histomonas meleagridis]